MADVAAMKAFNRELAAVVGATIEVAIKDGKTYAGKRKQVDLESSSVESCMTTSRYSFIEGYER